MNNRKKIWLSALVALLFVVSALLVPHVGLASQTMRPNQMSGQGALRSAPLAQVQGAATTSMQASLGQYAILSENAQYNPNALLTVTVGFKLAPGVQAFLNSINNPNSLAYRQYITPSEFGSMFGIGQQEYSTVASYFESYGLTVTPNSGLASMSLTGSVSAFEAAFHTKIGAYAIQYTSNGMWQPLFGNESGVAGSVTTSPVFYVNSASLSLPAQIAGLVSGITGLDGMMATPQLVLPKGLYPGANLTQIFNVSNNSTVSPSATYFSTTQIQGINSANYTWGSSYFAQFFGFPQTYQFLYPSTMHVLTGADNLWNGQNTIASEPDLGQGITVAVIEVGFIPPSWLQSFAQQVWNNPNQITSRLTYIGVGQPAFGLPDTFGSWVDSGAFYGWQLETALDIEYLATMAPAAHIDLIAVGAPFFSSFDMAYAATAQYLSGGSSIQVPAGLSVYSGTGSTLTSIPASAASVTITSNSYGAAEFDAIFFGSPMYITLEDQLLEEMNAVGITNFFASGDGGAALASGSFMPADSPGATAVGGGMVTAYGPGGKEFPVTGNTLFTFDAFPYFPLYVVPAQGTASYTYWSYGFGLGGTYRGIIGGGYGQSLTEQQPWWQNALDTYSSGEAVTPTVSGSAAFNMTIYGGFAFDGFSFVGWNYFYGGTSFATPISAGEWALIEEQANVAFGSPSMGNINPVLFSVHNAHEAGISSLHTNPFIPMTNIGSGFDWAPVNSFDWYYFNLSINQPYDPNVPWWYASLFGPQGSGWNYLQGLGMFDATLMDNALIGQTPSTQHALMNEPFSVLQVTPSGVMPISTLQGGTTYTLQIVLADGQMGGIYNVVAYSGGSGNGMYGGGQYMSLQTSSNGQFTYTPIYNTSGPGGSEYGFFSISSTGSSDWAFQMFAVEPVPLSAGVLTLGVTNGYGQLQTSTAEVSMFTTSLGAGTGFYNIYGSGQVFLNGSPLNGAVVTETSVNVSEFAIEDPTLPVSTYAPGVAVGHFISDAAGGFNFWTDAFLAEVNGPLYTQVVTLQATYGNLTSNVLTVYIEPQSGSFYPEVSLNSAGTALVGSVTFNDMKYVNYVNISIGNQTGQFTNVSYPAAFTDSLTGANVSGVYNGVIPVDFTNLPSPGTPIQLNMVAEGYNDLSFSFSFFGFSFVFLSVQSPIVWSDPITIANPGTMPTASLASSQSPTVNGNVTLSYAGSWEASGATGTLTIGYGNTVSTLLSTGALTGGYVWNSANYADGFYTLTYTVATPTGLHSSSSVVLYVDNTASQLNAEIVKLQGELSSAQATISTLQSELSSDNATIATMQSQINSLNAQVSSLTSQLSAEMAKYNATAAALATAKSQLNANNATIASLQSSLGADNTTIAAQSAQITSLKAQIATLQSELNAKKDFVPPAWYDVFGGAGALLLVVLGVVAGLVGVVIGRHRKTERSQKSPPMTNLFAVVVPQTKATTVHRTYRELRK